MRVIVDERESMLFEQCRILMDTDADFSVVQIAKEVLLIGDIQITSDDGINMCLIERKTIADLLASIKDGRYAEQSHRLIHASGFAPHNVIYLIEGSIGSIANLQEKKKVYSAITSLNHNKGFSIYRTINAKESAEFILRYSEKMDRNLAKNIAPAYFNKPVDATETAPIAAPAPAPTEYCNVVKKVKKENITPANMGEIVLSQIPGISSVTAIAIMASHTSIYALLHQLRETPNCLDNVTTETNGKTRKISRAAIANIKLFLANMS